MGKRSKVIEKDAVVIRFSGDSGDGMQLTGTLFSNTSALFGHDISTFPDYPAEIRAPQGTVGGVSGFQVHIGHKLINTPGDFTDILVAMNPAAIRANVRWLKKGSTIIYDSDNFTEKSIQRAGYKADPFAEDKLDSMNLIAAPITTLVKEALKDMDLDPKTVLRTKNMFALGLIYWLFDSRLKYTEEFIEEKFGKKPLVAEANNKVLRAGYYYGETIEALTPSDRVNRAPIKKGTYRNINGNQATAWGVLAAAEKAGLKLFIGSYPITPATGILEELALRKDMGVKSLQAEDEIAGICTSIGASFAGRMAVTSTSGPGLALKSEALNLAVMTELPLLVIDVQRGGPSTGLPTKTEQADLWQALYGRNGESPIPVIAASTPSDCFRFGFEAAKIAIEHMTPVILLTDGYLANGSEPWRIPSTKDLPSITVPYAVRSDKEFLAYERDPKTLVRKWAIPGTPGLEHRVGGLEKTIKGSVSYIPENHEYMVKTREEKVERIVNELPNLEVLGKKTGDLLVIGWGSTYGHITSAVTELQKEGYAVSAAIFNYIRPLPKNTAKVFAGFDKLLVCELNTGQFANYLRIKHQKYTYNQYNKVQGLPFTITEIKDHCVKLLKGKKNG